MKRRITIVVNRSSGKHAPGRLDELRAAAASGGVQLAESAPGDLESTARTVAEHTDVLAAAGGDGTVGTVAAIAIEHNLTFGVVPFGTLNHFAADVGLPKAPAEAVSVLTGGRVGHIDYATAGGKLFLNNASIGVYPALVRRRERQERNLGKWIAAAVELWRLMMHPIHPLDITVEAAGHRHELHTRFVFIGNNDYHITDDVMSGRQTLTGGNLHLFALKHRGRRTFFFSLLAPIFTLKHHPDALNLAATDITIEATGGTLELALDGEVHRLPAPVHFQIHPGGLAVLVPMAQKK